ncbi:MAG: SIR2 family protein [Bryobacteraceae bacterium]
MSNYGYDDYLQNPFLAVDRIGSLLRKGVLRLFLGAGASSGFGLPEWKTLIARVLSRDTDKDFMDSLPGLTPTDLTKLINDMDDSSEKYVRQVHEALYRDAATSLLGQLRQSPLLLSVAALVTGAHRGRIDSVVTYNYDDLLEQYLRMLGLAVCPRVNSTDLSTRADVEINYVHGRLPQVWEDSASLPSIILSDKSYRAKRARIDEGWSAEVQKGLSSKIGLFLTLSGDDGSILDLLERLQIKVRHTPYNGYWLLTGEAFERNKNGIRDVGMCPIPIRKEDVPQFIFSVCKAAAE